MDYINPNTDNLIEWVNIVPELLSYALFIMIMVVCFYIIFEKQRLRFNRI